MKNNITSAIKSEIHNQQMAISESESVIEKSKTEINRLKKMLTIYKQVEPEFSNEVPVKRKYTERKHKTSRKKLSPSMRRINWKPLIIGAIQQKGKPMKSKEIIDTLFKGKHASTMKVLKRRISVVLTLYKNDGVLKCNKNGRGLKYGLPEMFKTK